MLYDRKVCRSDGKEIRRSAISSIAVVHPCTHEVSTSFLFLLELTPYVLLSAVQTQDLSIFSHEYQPLEVQGGGECNDYALELCASGCERGGRGRAGVG